ncbi:glycosyltransferase [Porphyrobacter sp. SLTP]|uniref:glycosyltransferase n=1 Tax=Porphyrobacter sp. SLTP TaxID=2683266 RepID=UPI0014125140|nr:glycosyltransferase [Porphyrobacter sp. SLTP]NBB23581.1 glycosyltransferase [Porphyrobacter sp. SLTP]
MDPANGGPAYTVPRLCRALEAAKIEPLIFTLSEKGSAKREGATLFAPGAANIPVLGQLKLSPAMHRGMRKTALWADVIHSHGLWIAPNIYAGQVAANSEKPLVVSPRGMLAPGALQFSRLKKRLIWTLWQGPAYRNAALWHATSRQEANEIRAFGIKAPIVVIPNGVDLTERIARHDPSKSQRTILFLSRIHPKKGLAALVQAWAQLAKDRPDWQIVIAGPDEGGHRAELEAIVRQLQVPRITFLEPVYGLEKEALLADADLFVLPTISENFGVAVAEALGAGVPAIVTKGAPWQGLVTHKCGWWIDHGNEPLLAALSEATALPVSERNAMGLRGREWMRRDFGWDPIGQEMKDAYLWVKGTGDRPPCIYQ